MPAICGQICGSRFHPWVGKISWRREWQPTPVFLRGEFHGQRSLVGYSLLGHKESDTTEPLTDRYTHSSTALSVFMLLCKHYHIHLQNVVIIHKWTLYPSTLPQSLTTTLLLSVFVNLIIWKWQPTPVFLPGKFHGQKSLVGYSPWGCQRVWHELETKQLSRYLM